MADKAIRVLHVIGKMDRGGAESIIMNLYRAIDREKVQFDFVECSSEEAAYDNEIRELGGRIYRCPRMSIRSIMAFVSWWKHFFDEHASDYTVVHGHIGSSAAIYLNEAKKHGLYTIAHSHATTSNRSFSQFLYDVASYPTRYIADSFFACSRQAGIDRYGKRVGGASIVFNNAIDTERFQYSEKIRSEIRAKYGIDERCVVVGHVGRMTAEKNHSFIIDVFAEFKKEVPSARLILVGDGPLRSELEEKVQIKGLYESVCFLGIQDKVNDVLQAMDVFIFPSIFEGLGMAIIEAQANGLQCVVSEAIQDEAIMEKCMIHRLRLDDSVNQWVTMMDKCVNTGRKDCRQAIIDNGFDIKSVALWLQNYYLEKRMVE